jgi:hypothetical protein
VLGHKHNPYVGIA